MIYFVKLCLICLIVRNGDSAPSPSSSAPRSWPPMKSYDIWDTPDTATSNANDKQSKDDGLGFESRYLKSHYYFNRTHDNYINHYQQVQKEDENKRNAKGKCDSSSLSF